MAQAMWVNIKNEISKDIANGRLTDGDRLSTEPELAARFKTGRHSVRRAVEALVKEGKVNVEQGRGTFVQIEPVLVYTIGKRTRLHHNLLPQGYEVTSELLGGELINAPKKISDKLQLDAGAQVVVSTRRVLANATPISYGTVYHPAARFPDFIERRDLTGSTTKAYASYGIVDYVRASTEMFARPASPEEAKMLQQHPDLCVIVQRAVDTDLAGRPLSCSQVIWAAGRVKFKMESPIDD